MKVEKTINEFGQVIIKITLTEEEHHAISGTYVSVINSSFTTRAKEKDYRIDNFATLKSASYTQKPINIIPIDDDDAASSTPEQLLNFALRNYGAIITAKQAAHALCGTAQLVSKQTAIEFLAGEKRLYYKQQNGEIVELK